MISRIRLFSAPKFGSSTLTILIITACILQFAAAKAQVVVAIGHNFTASTFGSDSFALPPDPDGAIGPLHFVELINGRFSVFDKSTGAKVASMSDSNFWVQAGLSFPSGWNVTDPRVIFDSGSQRWFASQVDFDTSGNSNTNRFLLAVSTTSDPTGTWKALAIWTDPGGNDFADFPTFGLDAQAVYLSGDMFDVNLNPVGPSLIVLPKTNLLANPPVTNGMTSFGIMSYDVRGQILGPAVCQDNSGVGRVLSTAGIGIDNIGNFVTNNALVSFQVQNPSKPGQATLTSSTLISVPPYTAPQDPTQPDLSNNLDDGDARFSAKVYEVSGVLYAVQGTEINNLAALQWYRVDPVNQTVLESGTITDPVMDLFYPSIAANAAGTVVICYDGCSHTNFVSAFALVGNTVNGITTFGSPILLKAGVASYQNKDSSGTSRWGDYSQISVDPLDPNRFWTIQEFPSSGADWSTQVTEILTGFPNISFANSGSSLTLSWSGTLFTLQTSSTLANPNWAPVTQGFSTNNGVVTKQMPTSGNQGFFRLQAP